MKRILILFLIAIFFLNVFCRPEIKKSNFPYISALSNLQKSSETFSISYPMNTFLFSPNAPITTISPIASGTISSCTVNPTLPAGLNIDNSCNISGTPTTTQPEIAYTITASNGSQSVTTSIRISIAYGGGLSFYYPSVSYSFAIGVTLPLITPVVNGNATVFAINPALPVGLVFNTTTGQISGTPTNLSPVTSYSISASNSDGVSAFTSFNLSVKEMPPSNLMYSNTALSLTINTPISPLIATYTGTVTACNSVPPLPIGLIISNTCVITGTPTILQVIKTYTITASDSGGNAASTTISIDVLSFALTAFSYVGNPFTISQNIAMIPINPTITGTVTSCIAVPPLPVSLSLSPACVITGTPNSLGLNSSTITASNSGGGISTTISITVVPAPLGKRIFVTNVGYIPGTHFTSPVTADTRCNSDAGKPPGGGIYKAMIVGTGRVACTTANCSGGIAEHTDWVFAPTTMYYQANGTTLIGATTSYGAMPPSFANPISPANSKYWTGLNTDWTSSINNCVNWTSFTGGQFATCGGYLNNNSAAIFTDSWGVSGAPGPVSCIVSGTGLQLLCVEQ